MKDEIRLLKQRLKEMEQTQSNRLTDDCRENVKLQQQLQQPVDQVVYTVKQKHTTNSDISFNNITHISVLL